MSTNSVVVALKDLKPSQTNPRKASDEKDLKELATSITAHGIINPLTVRKIKGNGHFEIVAGWRRYQAAKLAGLKEVPVTVHDLTDDETLEVQIVENLQREDVHPLDEADGFKAIAKTKGLVYIAEKVGKSKRYVAERIALADLIPEGKTLLRQEKISLAVALVMVRVSADAQKDILTGDGRWRLNSAEQLWDHVKRRYFNDLTQAPFDLKESYDGVSACTICLARSTKNSDLFGNSLKGDMCLKPECFWKKMELLLSRKKAELKAAGQKFVTVSENYGQQERGILSAAQWMTPSRTCTTHVKGLIMDGKTLSRVGNVINVCIAEKCPACRGVAEKRQQASEQKEKDRQRTEMKKRAMERRIRYMMFKQLWDARAASSTTTLERVMYLIQTAISRLSHDDARAFCMAIGIDPRESKKKGVIGDRDYREAIKVWMSNYDNDDMYNVALMLGLVSGLYLSEFSEGNFKQLGAIAEKYGVTKQTAKVAIEEADRASEAEKAAQRAAKKSA